MSAPVRRRPPAVAFVAALLALLTVLGVGLFELIALAFSDGQFGDGGWVVVTVPLLLMVALVAGAALLLTGRSWLALLLPAAAIAVFLLVVGTSGSTTVELAVMAVVPAVAALLCALPGVRRWVAARRGSAPSGLPAGSQRGPRRRP
ncbi:hypothetical protein [Modestobacter excelsi]|uniref:hypothetical protein n=1 Tax=Modestobacter excelsi TaxID=2213161 RepID=UPI00110CD8E1|nr:hypothetical protein [Modestobacter excelsi]